MSLAFLFKKGWHTASIKNQEKVWLAEKKDEEEQQRIRDLQKQVEEERQLRELQELQGLSVHKGDERIDWMYEGPIPARNEQNEQEAEEYLLGKAFRGKKECVDIDATNTRYESANAEDKPTLKPLTANEAFRRLHEDPLLRMRHAEKNARDKVIANPVKMKRIHDEVERVNAEKKAAKKARKEVKKAQKREKRAKKHEKKRSKRHRSSSSSSSSDYTVPSERKTTAAHSNGKSDRSLRDDRYGLLDKRGVARAGSGFSEKDLAPREDLIAARERSEAEVQRKKEAERQRRSHLMTQEEKLRRMAEMEMDGKRNDERHKAISSARLEQDKSCSRDTPDSKGSFLRELDRRVLDDVTMEDRIARGRHYQQRDADSYNFVRK